MPCFCAFQCCEVTDIHTFKTQLGLFPLAKPYISITSATAKSKLWATGSEPQEVSSRKWSIASNNSSPQGHACITHCTSLCRKLAFQNIRWPSVWCVCSHHRVLKDYPILLFPLIFAMLPSYYISIKPISSQCVIHWLHALILLGNIP